MSILEVSGLYAGYDSRRSVISKVEFSVNEEEFVTVLGVNGAGKTTLIRALMGLCRTQGGSVLFQGEEISKASSKNRVKSGLAVVPQGQELFTSLSVEENLRAGGFSRKKREVNESVDWIFETFPLLLERRKQQVMTLSGGERALVAVARALVSKPTLLLLDEPSLGLSPGARPGVFNHLRRLVEQTKLSILMVEQDAPSALAVADRCYGMKSGEVLGWQNANLVDQTQLEHLYFGNVEHWGEIAVN
jgi:branched-chain amino acid transport system ATP-binding protein